MNRFKGKHGKQVFISSDANYFAHNAMAGLIGPKDWNGDDINCFLETDAFPDLEASVSMLDFSGEWMSTRDPLDKIATGL